jgi:hypothetical protein
MTSRRVRSSARPRANANAGKKERPTLAHLVERTDENPADPPRTETRARPESDNPVDPPSPATRAQPESDNPVDPPRPATGAQPESANPVDPPHPATRARPESLHDAVRRVGERTPDRYAHRHLQGRLSREIRHVASRLRALFTDGRTDGRGGGR